MKNRTIEIPRIEQFDALAGIPCPRIGIGEWGVDDKDTGTQGKENCDESAADDGFFANDR